MTRSYVGISSPEDEGLFNTREPEDEFYPGAEGEVALTDDEIAELAAAHAEMNADDCVSSDELLAHLSSRHEQPCR